ncbi:MAG: hypothetical protein O2894_07020 [Planctomycetota bacterium]|nr:hypothetical protein [Planctomycetota bacterium]
MSKPTDVMGTPLTEAEASLLAAYRGLEALLTDDLAPSVHANISEALASLWQAVNDLALTDDRPAV